MFQERVDRRKDTQMWKGGVETEMTWGVGLEHHGSSARAQVRERVASYRVNLSCISFLEPWKPTRTAKGVTCKQMARMMPLKKTRLVGECCLQLMEEYQFELVSALIKTQHEDRYYCVAQSSLVVTLKGTLEA